jgi:hypothetical protein
MLGAMIQMYISAAYDGGAEQFAEDFNLFLTDAEAIFAPKSDKRLSDDFIARFNEMGEGMGLKAVYANHSNFEGMSHEEAGEYLNEHLKERMSGLSADLRVSVNPALFDALCEGTEKDSEEGQAVIEALTGIPGVNNLRIKFSDETYFDIAGEETEESTVEPQYVALATGRPERDTIINQDDHMDIKIALGQTQTVDEFIALM